VTVLAADDNTPFRAVLGELVASTEGFELCGSVSSGEAAVEAAERLSPALVLIDKRMPGIGGIEACRRITQRNPEVVVFILSVEEPDLARRWRDAGASAFIRKEELSRGLLNEAWQAAVRSGRASAAS
jgi:two-component system invasion response regulator UvrY